MEHDSDMNNEPYRSCATHTVLVLLLRCYFTHFMLSKTWIDAWKLTQELGVKAPPLPPASWAGKSYISNELTRGLLGTVKRQFLGQPLSAYVLKCFDVHNFIYNALYDEFRTPCYLTLGWVEHRGKPLFRHSREDLVKWAAIGVPNRDDVHLHCWITFPSGEMLDATIASVIALSNHAGGEAGEIYWFENETCGPFVYHPTIIGMESLKLLRLAF